MRRPLATLALTHTHTHTHTHTQTHMHAHTHTCTRMHTHAHAHTHTCTHTHAHTCMHTHTHTCRRRGGLDEERAERQRWIQREHKRILDSVQGMYSLCTAVMDFFESYVGK